MEKIMIHGQRPLRGEVEINGSKNAAVAILPAALLANDVVILEKQSLSKKNKLCGGIITPKAYSLLTSEFSKKDINKLIKTK